MNKEIIIKSLTKVIPYFLSQKILDWQVKKEGQEQVTAAYKYIEDARTNQNSNSGFFSYFSFFSTAKPQIKPEVMLLHLKEQFQLDDMDILRIVVELQEADLAEFILQQQEVKKQFAPRLLSSGYSCNSGSVFTVLIWEAKTTELQWLKQHYSGGNFNWLLNNDTKQDFLMAFRAKQIAALEWFPIMLSPDNLYKLLQYPEVWTAYQDALKNNYADVIEWYKHANDIYLLHKEGLSIDPFPLMLMEDIDARSDQGVWDGFRVSNIP